MVGWSIELSEFDISYETRGLIKEHVLADFAAEMPSPVTSEGNRECVQSMDGVASKKGNGAGVILEGLDGVMLE